MAPRLAPLLPEHLPLLQRFLAAHADSSMFLRSNLARVGVEDTGRPLSGRWLGAWEAGALVAVASHAWNGNLLLQAPVHAGALAAATVRASGRPLTGVIGPWEQVVAAREALGCADAPTRMSSAEPLFSLDVSLLVVPQDLARGVSHCRVARPEDLDRCAQWRVEYSIETLRQEDSRAMRREARESVARLIEANELFVLDVDGTSVACSAFNATLPDCVQIGGVYTPPALRSKGYGRSVVAGSLLACRGTVTRALLFTDMENRAAQRAYRAIGFREVGSYGLVLFRDEVR